MVGYEAQWRLYIKDLHELPQTDPSVAWSSVRAFKIDSMQGNEADVVIFDYVRSEKKHGFMGDSRRLNVACSRGRFAFYFVASARTLKVGRFGYRSPAKLHKCFESYNAKVTLQAPDSVTAGVTAGDVDNVNILGTTKRAPAPLPFYTPPPPALNLKGRIERVHRAGVGSV